MSLTLVAVSLNEQPLSQPITASFDARGGTIGRADHNTMALPDPQRHVSRQQAEVALQGASYIIRNVGAANPIVVGTRAVGPGETAVLGQDEQIRIGGYLLKAMLNAAPVAHERPNPRPATSDPFADLLGSPAPVAPQPAPASPAPADPFADLLGTPVARPAAPTPASDPFADLLGSPAPAPWGPSPSRAPAPAPMFAKAPTSNDPFADLLGTPAPPPAPAHATRAPPSADPFADLLPPPSGVHAKSVALAPPPPAVAQLPDDFDPFAAPSAPALPPKAQIDPFADLMPSASAAPSIDAMFGLGASPSGQADPLAGFMSPAAPAASAGPSIDPLAMFGAPMAAPAPGLPQADNVSALHDAFKLPGGPAPAPPPAPQFVAPPARPQASTTATSGDAAAMWWAFCEGAGITPSLPDGPMDQRMREMGLILRRAVEGTLQLIAVRASTKHELRAGVTVIQQANNNPLKFSPDAKAGLEQMIQPPMRGFLTGPAAMQDAMHDLVGHSIGTVAGMRAAVEGMLDRFAPQALESKLVGGGMFDSVLPGHRKAKLWDMYMQQHGAIREEAQEDFHNLFGKAFLAAYEQQVERLKQEASKP
ncbi:MAG: type VI secretion system-associated FHA domain protein TagH [Vitreoscilla sp.]|nr:type VI secretion system-associated FHA domain protein TagH [Vitreoscilla sp.]MBP6674471.1 type VI secretion system-associated FHA domain protein TagH [Vitreoscilla sp.]